MGKKKYILLSIGFKSSIISFIVIRKREKSNISMWLTFHIKRFKEASNDNFEKLIDNLHEYAQILSLHCTLTKPLYDKASDSWSDARARIRINRNSGKMVRVNKENQSSMMIVLLDVQTWNERFAT